MARSAAVLSSPDRRGATSFSLSYYTIRDCCIRQCFLITLLLLLVFQVQDGLHGPAVRPLHPVPRVRARDVRQAVPVPVPGGLGRTLLQRGPQLLHQPPPVPQRRHLQEHRPGPLHVRLPARLRRQELRGAHQQRVPGAPAVRQRRHLPGKKEKRGGRFMATNSVPFRRTPTAYRTHSITLSLLLFSSPPRALAPTTSACARSASTAGTANAPPRRARTRRAATARPAGT